MRTFILIPFLLLLSLPAFALELGDQWLKVREIDGRSSFKLRSNPKVLLSVQFRKSDNPKSYSKGQLDELVEAKKKTLAIIGIQNYKIAKREIKKKDMKLIGSYQSSSGPETNFVENHFHNKGTDYQLLILATKESKHPELSDHLDKVKKLLEGK